MRTAITHVKYVPMWTEAKAPSLAEMEAMAHEVFERLPKTFRTLCEGVIIRVDDFPTDEVLDELQAQTASSGLRVAAEPAVTDVSAQRRRPLRRVPIYRQEEWAPDVYPRYNPGPNAVRDCTANYVQEYRPSGTVITPRMNCYWRPG